MVKVTEIYDEKIWEEYVLEWEGSNFLQSWYWGEFHEKLKHKILRKGFFRGGKLVGVMLCIVERAKRATYLTIPAGPLIDWDDKALVRSAIKEIKEICRKEKCSFVRIRPQILDSLENRRKFSKMKFVAAPMHLHVQYTLKLDLSKSDEQLLSEMRKSTRYEIKQAQKMGIIIETSENLKELADFYQLQLGTAGRQMFVPFSEEYLTWQFETFAKRNKVRLYTAKLEDKVLAQGMVILYGSEADYHYGASSILGRKYPGAYLMLWKAIEDAKKMGMKKFDLWGIAPEDNKKHRFYGVSLFKRGFGGEVVEYLPARDLVISWPKYVINWIIEYSRKRMRNL